MNVNLKTLIKPDIASDLRHADIIYPMWKTQK